jgi:hypothetical protein
MFFFSIFRLKTGATPIAIPRITMERSQAFIRYYTFLKGLLFYIFLGVGRFFIIKYHFTTCLPPK